MTTDKIDNTDISAVELLQNINSGLTDSKLLDKLSRRRCVELLIAEGCKHAQISQVLKVSEKTVTRDIKEIKVRNELTPDIGFAKQTVGDLFQKAMNHHAYLMRLARIKNASVSEKMQSEFAAWRVLKELTEKLQSLGYLPSKPTEIIGNFYNHTDNEESDSPEAMRKMLLGIEESAKDAGVLDKEVTAKIELLRARIAQSEIAVDINQLEAKTSKEREENYEEKHQ